MAETDGQEKTEQATGKHLSESRDKGQVAKSTEVNSFAVFTTGLLLLYLTQKFLSTNLNNLSFNIFHDLDKMQIDQGLVIVYAYKGILFFFYTVAPVFIGLVIISIIASYGQVGFKFSPNALAPKFSKFNPVSNIKSIFFSSRSLVEVSKSLLKLVIISFFTYSVLKGFVFTAVGLVNYSIEEIVKFMVEAAYTLLWRITLVYAAIAAVDFAFQKYKHKKDLMMTKQQIKEENKQTEGNPEIKGKIKQMQFKAARSRMMKAIPTADVVITNPTHVAVALKYETDKDASPKVIAKGLDELAQRIKKIATENNVPLHEDVQLARSLYKICEVGDEIPTELFKTVAQILAYIYKLKNEKKRRKSIV